MSYATPELWRKAAMQRLSVIDACEIERRRGIADKHYCQQGMPDSDVLADHELYILGKMELDEYRDYLLFKGMCENRDKG